MRSEENVKHLMSDLEIGMWCRQDNGFDDLRKLQPNRHLGSAMAKALREVFTYTNIRQFDTGDSNGMIVYPKCNVCNLFGGDQGINLILGDWSSSVDLTEFLKTYIVFSDGGMLPNVSFIQKENKIVIRAYSLPLCDMIKSYERIMAPLPWETGDRRSYR